MNTQFMSTENPINFGFYVTDRATTLTKAKEVMEKWCPQMLNTIKLVVNQNEADSDQLLQRLKENEIDYLFIFTTKVLKGDILKEYENRIINFHPSLLPAFKGFFAIDQALKARAFLLGNTAHFVTEDIDGGPIIMQSIFYSGNFKDYPDVLDQQVNMLIQLMYWFKEGRVVVEDGKVRVKDANYNIGEYIPNIDT